MNATLSIAQRACLARLADRNVPSPCISVCRMDEHTGWCLGCWRTLDEVAQWGQLDDASRRAVWSRIEARAAGVRP